MIQRTVKSRLNEVPGQRSDHIRETFSGFVPRPPRRDSGDWPGLQQMQSAAGEPPLDILWKAVAGLNLQEQPGQFGQLRWRQVRLPSCFFAELHLFRAAGSRDYFAGLLRHVCTADRSRRTVQSEVVHLPLTAHHRFAQTEVRIHDQLVQLTIDRIEAKAHAGHIALHHLLNYHGHRGQRMIEMLLVTIGNCPVGPQREEALLYLLQNELRAGAIQIGLVLSGKSRAGQIFHSRGGTN